MAAPPPLQREATDCEFKIHPNPEAILIHHLPSNQQSPGLQCLFVKNAFSPDVNKKSLHLYGLTHPLSQDPSVKWLKKNKKCVEEVIAFAFLQGAEKCMPFKSLDKLSFNSKITVPATAYLKLLQFFGVVLFCKLSLFLPSVLLFLLQLLMLLIKVFSCS